MAIFCLPLRLPTSLSAAKGNITRCCHAKLQAALAAENKMKRRVANGPRKGVLRLPSWSWMGWHGEIHRWSWHGGLDYFKSSRTGWRRMTEGRTVRVVQWFLRENESGTARPLNSNWDRYKDLCLQEEADLLPNWSRHPYNIDIKDIKSGGTFPEFYRPRYFFKHKSDPDAEFWYSIPIGQDLTQNPISESNGALLICCRTQRCWLHVGEEKYYNPPSVVLRDTAGTWAGLLIPQDIDDISNANEMSLDGGNSLELVSISRGYCYNKATPASMAEWELEERPNSSELYEWYNVLWIGWEDGIAYRKGLGRVYKEVWEAQDLEWIDLTLG